MADNVLFNVGTSAAAPGINVVPFNILPSNPNNLVYVVEFRFDALLPLSSYHFAWLTNGTVVDLEHLPSTGAVKAEAYGICPGVGPGEVTSLALEIWQDNAPTPFTISGTGPTAVLGDTTCPFHRTDADFLNTLEPASGYVILSTDENDGLTEYGLGSSHVFLSEAVGTGGHTFLGGSGADIVEWTELNHFNVTMSTDQSQWNAVITAPDGSQYTDALISIKALGAGQFAKSNSIDLSSLP